MHDYAIKRWRPPPFPNIRRPSINKYDLTLNLMWKSISGNNKAASHSKQLKDCNVMLKIVSVSIWLLSWSIKGFSHQPFIFYIHRKVQFVKNNSLHYAVLVTLKVIWFSNANFLFPPISCRKMRKVYSFTINYQRLAISSYILRPEIRLDLSNNALNQNILSIINLPPTHYRWKSMKMRSGLIWHAVQIIFCKFSFYNFYLKKKSFFVVNNVKTLKTV